MKYSHRLGRSKNLQAVLRRGRRFSSALFLVSALANDLERSRFAFVVPASTHKRSAVRNRLRRRMRERVRMRFLSRSPAQDAAIFCKKEAVAAPRNIFYAALDDILARVWKG